MRTKYFSYVVLSASLGLLTACGGGGGQSNNNETLPKTWGTAQLLETQTGDAWSPNVTHDAQGNAMAVWYQNDGTRTNIWASYYTPSNGWSGPEVIDAEDLGSATEPKVVMDANGNATAIWQQYDGTHTNIWANRYTAVTGVWGNAQKIETDNGEMSRPQIAVDESGNVVAMWDGSSQYNGTLLWINRYDIDTGWGTAQTLDSNIRSRDLAVAANGTAIAVWEKQNNLDFNIWSSIYTPVDGWVTPALIENTSGHHINPEVTFDTYGNAMVYWRYWDSVNSNYAILYNTYSPTDGWGTEREVYSGTLELYAPKLAFDSNGNALATWNLWDSVNLSGSIAYSYYTSSSGNWSAAQTLVADHVDEYRPLLKFDANNNAFFIWSQIDSQTGYSNIMTSRYTSTGWSAPQVIDSEDLGSAYASGFDIDSNGNAVVVWQQSEELQGGGARTNVWVNQYR